MMINIGKTEVPALITQDTENMMSTSFASRIKKYLNNECIRIGKKKIQHVTIETKHGFLGFTSFKLKKNSKNFVVLGQQWKKNYQYTNKPWNEKTKNDTTNNPYVGI